MLSLGGWCPWEADYFTELFDPTSELWGPTGNLVHPRTNGALVKLANGDVLVAGGWMSETAELFTGGAWRTTRNSPDFRSDFPTLTLLADDTVLMVGGSAHSSAARTWRYTPSADQWAAGPNLTFSRQGNTATRMHDGRVLIVGGHNEVGWPSHTRALNFTEVYHNGVLSHGPDLLTPRGEHTATLINNGRDLLVIGGVQMTQSQSYAPVASVEIYKDGATSFAHAPARPSQLAVRHTATLLPDGRVLVTGGSASYTGACSTTVELYDPSTNTWATGPSMNHPRCGHTATLLADGRVLVTGGDFTASSTLPAEIYTP
ncbi:Kelch repeat-containing protein [Pyxidicoccus sp. 3LFB2]